MNFKIWIESQMPITKLAFFDYDGTLAVTPKPPQNWAPSNYVAPDGKVRKDNHWWTHPDSLENYQLNQFILGEFKKARMEQSTKAVLLTGRQGMRTAHLIRGKLRDEGLFGKRQISARYEKAQERHDNWPNGPHPEEDHPHAHQEFFKGDMRTEDDYPKTSKGKPDGDTASHKKYVVQKLMNDNVQLIDFWDDQVEFVDDFLNLFKQLLKNWPNLKKINYYHVTPTGITTIPIA